MIIITMALTMMDLSSAPTVIPKRLYRSRRLVGLVVSSREADLASIPAFTTASLA